MVSSALLSRTLLPLAFLSCGLLLGCLKQPWRDLFHVQSADARLPVVVYGPPDSRTLVLFQHGGPDGSAGIDPLPPGLARLSDEVLVVVWAQRSTGLASGVSRSRDNTVAQHVADLDAVRQVLQTRYPNVRRWVLAGHSWGVALTLAYLEEKGEAGVSALILSDGFEDYDDNAERAFARIGELSSQRASEVSEESEFWINSERFGREESAKGAPYSLDTIVRASNICERIESELDRPEPNSKSEPVALTATTSPLLLPDGQLVQWNFRTMISEITHLDLSKSLSKRRLPALLIWGEYDCRAPVATAEAIRQRYGGAVTLHVVEGATHFALYSQPRGFSQPVQAFLQALP